MIGLKSISTNSTELHKATCIIIYKANPSFGFWKNSSTVLLNFVQYFQCKVCFPPVMIFTLAILEIVLKKFDLRDWNDCVLVSVNYQSWAPNLPNFLLTNITLSHWINADTWESIKPLVIGCSQFLPIVLFHHSPYRRIPIVNVSNCPFAYIIVYHKSVWRWTVCVECTELARRKGEV